MKHLRRSLFGLWQPLLVYGFVIALFLLLFGYRLGSLPAGLSPAEVSALRETHSWRDLLNNPLYLPHKAPLYLLQTLGIHGIAALRAVSAFWALITTGLFFSVLRYWHTKPIAATGTILFATSTWFLVAARLVTPEIMQAGVVILLAVGGWLRYGRARISPILLGVITAALLCYIPGFPLILLGIAIWQWRSIKLSMREAPASASLLAGLLFLVLVGPLIFAIVRDPNLGRPLIGIPYHLPSLLQIAKGYASIPLALFLRAPLNQAHWLGRLPLLDVFTASMFVLGVYSFYYRLQLDRAKLLLGAGLVISTLIAISGASLTMLLPLLYIIVTAGVTFLVRQWLMVFPRNPLARGVGLSLVTIAVLMSCFYQVGRYYEAWQHTPSTKQIFVQQP